jgi:hypothetical protein
VLVDLPGWQLPRLTTLRAADPPIDPEASLLLARAIAVFEHDDCHDVRTQCFRLFFFIISTSSAHRYARSKHGQDEAFATTRRM